jgi:dTDP-glucose 4,6-dehydratase
MIPIAVDMIIKSMTGSFNLVNPGVIQHNEILQMYKEIIDPNFTWENFSQEDLIETIGTGRSDNVHLSTEKLQKLYPDLRNAKVAVRDVLEKRKIATCSKENQEIDFVDSESTVLLVTGGCGFIGSNFINYIHKEFLKIKIINVDNLSCSKIENIKTEVRESQRYTFVESSITSLEAMQKVFDNYPINYIIHFAAETHVDNSYINCFKTTDVNVIGTNILLELSRKLKGLKKFIYISTDEVYGDSLNGEVKTENSLLMPTNAYSASKASADLLTQSYYRSFRLPTVITRSNNIYGPNQEEKLIPHFINLLKQDKKVTVYGTGNNFRFFIHVSDIVKAFRLILEKGKIGEIYNIAGTEEYSVLELAKKIIRHAKNTEDYDKWINYVQDRPYNDFRYLMSGEYFSKSLNWKPTIKFEDGLKELING